MIGSTAEILFSDGWRSQDLGELAYEYDLPEWEAAALCRDLRDIGLRHRLEADIIDSRSRYAVIRQGRESPEPEACWFFADGGRAMDEALGMWEDMEPVAKRLCTLCVREICEDDFEGGVWEPRVGKILWTCGGKTAEGLRFETEEPSL